MRHISLPLCVPNSGFAALSRGRTLDLPPVPEIKLIALSKCDVASLPVLLSTAREDAKYAINLLSLLRKLFVEDTDGRYLILPS